jgi:hypothetical protein
MSLAELNAEMDAVQARMTALIAKLDAQLAKYPDLDLDLDRKEP